jgi:hypothetical protein
MLLTQILQPQRMFVGRGFSRDERTGAKRLPLAVQFPRAFGFNALPLLPTLPP